MRILIEYSTAQMIVATPDARNKNNGIKIISIKRAKTFQTEFFTKTNGSWYISQNKDVTSHLRGIFILDMLPRYDVINKDFWGTIKGTLSYIIYQIAWVAIWSS